MVDRLLRVHIQSQRAFGPRWTLSYNSLNINLRSMFMFTADMTCSAKSTSLGPCMSIAAGGNDSTAVYLIAVSLLATLASRLPEPTQGAADDEMPVAVYVCL